MKKSKSTESKETRQRGVEIRYFASKIERRNDGSQEGKKSRTIGGYAALFDAANDMGWYHETILPGAFDNALKTSDVRCLFNHDDSELLGRTSSGTCRLSIDQKGLFYEVDIPESRDDILELVDRGDLAESSYQFRIKEQRWTERQGQPDLREIIDYDIIFDVSPVTFPADPDTSVAKRSRDESLNKESDADKAKQEANDAMADLQVQEAARERLLQL